ncbi:hypothetical protein [Streptomyces benahoarensis]|uniref:Secreted protein n=1 Tax=Streptomyces benahoarensis TaxID=2595054 RepID=A0A553Z6D1_9ACTN|nr:hypothetical protein [Streptomyces benahoarensis]TSB19829.1 hypothetical protein FNJ62_21775 [Streptomyces benahoarensis]TSB37006.1 hypothetical protein FNZ23_19000 [Streptomyces benahoarensis]
MRTLRTLTAALLATGGLLTAAAPALADDPAPTASSGSPSPGSDGEVPAPTEAGTSFRTAALMLPGQRATADASTGDYLYWAVPLDQGQDATVRAKVKLPETARHGEATWRLDVYDGLRRRQACRYGMQARTVASDATSVELACTLRTVRAWAEPWADDPLPGRYYLRLTTTEQPQEDLGLPVRAEVSADVKDAGGAHAVDGALAAPLVPGATAATGSEERDGDDADDGAAGASASPSATPAATAAEPDGGWASGWWSDRWIWTAAGGVAAALMGIAGYRLTAGRGRPSRVPPGV